MNEDYERGYDRGVLDTIEEVQRLTYNWNELKKWLEENFKGMTIEELGIDELYRKGMYRMNEYTLDKISELEEGGNNDC